MKATVRSSILGNFLLGLLGLGFGEANWATAADTAQQEVVRIGAVASSPHTVTIFRGLTRYLHENDFPCEYVLYSSYDSLVEALDRGHVDIAWNTPLAHARYHVKNQCQSQTLVMRDIDFGVRSTLLARVDSGIETLQDLAGKRLLLGSSQAAEATVLPIYDLKKQGLDLQKIQVVSLDREVDSKGNPCASPQHVLRALEEGRGDAGIVTTSLWQQIQKQPTRTSRLREVWTSKPFSHCVFTAAASFDKNLAARFTKLMTAMDCQDPATCDLMRLEGTKAWQPGSPEGFQRLVQALQAK